ncbi:CIC11C00000002195 [Sungouiella intermedia]|uniref:chitin synthase n=1 Tax=Sungouiella intermedia TaxID=45354 RepID=A0A1L0BWL6_9ASCO|nr:CIC11C00000002195 [[Candida] intermedia]
MSGFRNSGGSNKYQEFDPESGDLNRKRSLVRPERQRIDQSHPMYHYAQVVNQESDHLKVQPSLTGLEPTNSTSASRKSFQLGVQNISEDDEEGIPLMNIESPQKAGREVYGLNDEVHDVPTQNVTRNVHRKPVHAKPENNDNDIYFWKVYCYVITFWAPGPLLKLFGLKTKSRQFAWREKIGLITCILYIGAFVAYITFGFTKTVCDPGRIKMRTNTINGGYLIINGRAYDLTSSQHPGAAGISPGTNILYPPINAGGMDGSFLFQNVNGHCQDLIVPRENCSIPTNGNELAWYMPCRLFNQDGSSSVNKTSVYYDGWACHTSSSARDAYYGLEVNGDVYFTWDDIKNSSRNLVVYSGVVLDLDLINWILTDDVTYPQLFNDLRDDDTFKGHDISLILSNSEERRAAKCLTEIIKVGVVDSDSIGCIASKIVLVVSLVFILSVVILKFLIACYFRWYVSRKQGATEIDNKSMAAREREIEDWVETPAASGPISTVPVKARANYKTQKTNRQSVFFKSGNGLTLIPNSDLNNYYAGGNEKLSKAFKYTTMTTQAATLGKSKRNLRATNTRSMLFNQSRNLSVDLLSRPQSVFNPFDGSEEFNVNGLSPDLIHPDVVPQPPVEYQPFGYPLAHMITLVTCYSEDEEGLRLTLDSIATTDYPNSHKLVIIVCDGLIKGSGNDRTTPEIALDLMTDFCVPPEDVQAHSYVAVAQGSKRHNMAKVYAGFYKYNDETVPPEKQQRVPVLTVVKCGTPEEAGGAKPGNRGKRDSQIILMSFFQKVTFDERMTELEYALLESIWRVTGLMSEFYEIILMVDADTKVYPDCLTHMCAEMIKDPTIMGLCGETKITNKSQSWVTAIQVFEYYISHHQAKAFESVFGSVTCLPGCFCMYRIKAPKGDNGYWVPILANPDIVERYSDNVTNTLHKKNLLLLGEDRYLTALMLRTFPKRKQIFVPKAACTTLVPDTFKVLLSQRRRWINSTVHNLMELVLVRDLCGTFCFSMQFVIFIELVGTVVLPAAITFTIYVVVYAIVSRPTPVMSLVLLGVIFGLPGLLIVITVSSLKYLIYFFIYILALPIWNFVLPCYAFWKFDDFSWGETRTVAGGDKGAHGDKEGIFDSSSIVMKRWREWERDRRAYVTGGLTVPGAAWDPASAEKDMGYSGGSLGSLP